MLEEKIRNLENKKNEIIQPFNNNNDDVQYPTVPINTIIIIK